jgi:shikimate dehydrogenase
VGDPQRPVGTLAAVLGFPVRHSRSPAMMNAALRELGLDWRYLALPIPPARFAETVRALPASGYVGANVTIPHKLAAFELADEATATARAIGAANTLSFQDGRIAADNTDASGLLDALAEPVAGRRALVLGAGGAARAAVWALREAGAEVWVWNRTRARAAALAAELGVAVHDAAAAGSPQLLVNTTSVGLEPGSGLADLPLAGLEPATVVDLVYGPEPTAIERWAGERGMRVVDGLEVLVCQGARSLERWTGRPAPVDAMRAAVQRGQPV